MEEEHTRVTKQLENVEADLESARDSLQTTQQSDSDSTGSEQFDSLQETRSQLEDITYDPETEQDSVSSLEDEHAGIEAELEELSTIDEDELDDLASEIERFGAGNENSMKSSLSS